MKRQGVNLERELLSFTSPNTTQGAWTFSSGGGGGPWAGVLALGNKPRCFYVLK